MNRLSARELAVAERVRERRAELGLSQTDVAEALGLSKAGYGHYDRGVQPFTVDQLFSLSRILGRSVAWLIGLDTDLTEHEDALLTAYRSLPEAERGPLLRIVRAYTEDHAK